MRRRRLFILIGVVLLLLLAGAVRELVVGGRGDRTAPEAPEDRDPVADPRVASSGRELGDGSTEDVPELTEPVGGRGATEAAGEDTGTPAAPGLGGRKEPIGGKESIGGAGEGPGSTGAESTPGYFPQFGGKVVDVLTGEPIPGARVIYGPLPNWTGDDADADGSFRFNPRPRMLDSELPYRVRVFAPGYETVDLIPGESELLVELTPSARTPEPGRIKGRIEDSEGRAVRGVVTVKLGDEAVTRHWLAVLAGEHGEFVLDGVAPGGWLVSARRGDPVNVFVADGAEAEVVLRTGVPREEVEAAGITEEETKRLEELRERFMSTLQFLEAMKKGGAAEEVIRNAEEGVQVLGARIQSLEVAQRGMAARRRIRVTGLAGHEDIVLVAEFFGRASTERWWGVVHEGSASFPALFPGAWHLTLKLPGGDIEADVEVTEEGDAIPFPPEALPR